MSVFVSVKSWDESASLLRRSSDIFAKRAGNGEDARELARILYCCPLRPLHAGEWENAAGLVVGLDVGLHVVANAGAPLGGGSRYRVCTPDPACGGCVRGVPFDARHSAIGVDPRSARPRGAMGMTTGFSGPSSLTWRPIAVSASAP